MFEAVLATLLALPVCYQERAWAGKREQLEDVARVIADVSAQAKRPEQRAAELIAIGYWESRFCWFVQVRKQRRAGNGYWQLETFEGVVTGPERSALENGAFHASFMLSRSYQCGSRPRDVFTGYAGRRCGTQWATLNSRERTYYWAKGRIENAK
jgi:hypothetical protein